MINKDGPNQPPRIYMLRLQKRVFDLGVIAIVNLADIMYINNVITSTYKIKYQIHENKLLY